MKKIKKKISKRKVKGTPHIGVFLHVERRHTLARFTLEWFQHLKIKLEDTINLSLWVSGIPNQDLTQMLNACYRDEAPVTHVSVSKGLSRGRQLNEGLEQLRDHDLDAVIPVAPGEMLSEKLLLAYREHLSQGGLFCGLLDQYLYDPTSLRCMHWSRAEFYEGTKRACALGMMIAKPILKALKWQLWPSTSDRGLDALHEKVMERMGEAFKLAPPKTCLLQSMASYDAPAVSIKSELGRVLFDEGNWQKLPGLSFADFEIVFEDHLGDEWIQRVEDFDERIQLDVLVEPPPQGANYESLWRELYGYLSYKFDPYARVNIQVICDEDEASEIDRWGSDWSPLVVKAQDQTSRWNEALNTLSQSKSDAVLLGGKGSIVDLKTIEHYLIYLFKNGARLLSASNFFLALSDEHQGYFWPGVSNSTFKDVFGFGTCIHRSYLNRLGASPLGVSGGLSESACEAFAEICAEPNTQEQRVMFQCVAHKLGMIAFDLDGAIGLSPSIRLSDLKPVQISNHLPGPALIPAQHNLLTSWENGLSLFHTKPTYATSISSDVNTSGESTMTSESTMSPLERARALLQKSQAGATSTSSTSPTSKEPASTPKESLSPLERAKALLKSSQDSSNSSETAQAASAPAPQQALSPLERAKALLKEPQPAAEPRPAAAQSEQPLSPLDRAKALLLQSTAARAESSKEEEQPVAPQELTKAAIDSALEGAEALVSHLQSQLDLVQEQNQTDESALSPSDVICEQGEVAYEAGDESKAKTLFESALMIDPSNVRALNNLGVMALSGDDRWQALSYFLMGLIQAPTDDDLMLNLNGLFDLNPDMKTVRSVIFD